MLVIKLGALGDFVQALGPMAAIRRHHPEADITLLTTEPFFSFGRDCGYFDHIWTDHRPRWTDFRSWAALYNKLNRAGFDRVYDLQNNDRTGLYFRLFRTKPEWVGTVKGASHRNNSSERTAGHAFEGHKQTLALAGINDVRIDDMQWIKGDLSRFHIQNPYVILVPGCAPGRPEKRWDANNFGILARTLYGWGYTPVVIGTHEESDLGNTISQFCPQAHDLTGKTALGDIVLIGRHAAAAIGNDTGPMHLIAPTGCPCYVLFSSHSDPVKHAPLGPQGEDQVRTIQKDELNMLTVDEVLENIKARDFRKTDQGLASSGQ